MLIAVVTVTGTSVDVTFPEVEEGDEEHAEVPESDLNPIAPEPKELLWGFGSFVVFALLMRFFLFPRLRKGMDARANLIRGDLETADSVTAQARAEVAEYEAQVAALKAEANLRVEAARDVLEAERQERLTEVNGRIAERRAAAAAEVEAAREAARSHVEDAVADVAARAGELATGRRPSDTVVRAAVADVMGAGVTS